MGEVFKPEDFVNEKRGFSDLSPGLKEFVPETLQQVVREVKLVKIEVEKIKQVLKANGIVVE